MNPQLRVLVVEDSESDTGLIARQLQRAGYDLEYARVETAAAMQAALAQQDWDLVIADYNLPRFSGPAALEILKARALDMPFIVVSGTMGEEKAVAMMKSGAHDYIMKDNLARLVPAVARELREAEGRRERRRADAALIKSEATLSTILRASPTGIGLVVERVFQWVNKRLLDMTGYSREELIGQRSRMLYFSEAEYKRVGRVTFAQIQETGWAEVETQWRNKDGSPMGVYVNTVALDPANLSAGVVFAAMDITARQEAEAELRQSEQQYRLLVNNIPGFVFKGYADYTVEFLNDKIKGLTGYAKEEFNTKRLKWSDVVIQDDLQNAREIFMQALKGDGQYIRKYRLRKKGGEKTWILERGQILKRQGGEIDSISGIFFDITESKQAEEALRESQGKLNAILETTPAGIFLVNAEGCITFANRTMADLFAYRHDEILGTPYLDLVHPDERSLGSGKMKSLMAGEIDFVRLERRYLAADGREFWGQLSGRQLVDANGGFVGLIGVITDITVQKQLEEHLRVAAQKWRTTFDAIGDGVCLLDGAHQILQCNQAMMKFVGRPFPEIVGRKCWEVVHQTAGPIDGCPYMRLKHSKQRETLLLAQDDRWFKITVDPILDEDGVLLGVVHIISDVTQAKQTEEALEESFHKLKRALSSTVQVLSSTVEIRDPYTAGHQRRVALLASAIAEALGFPREQLEGMQVLGYLHDIGKIAVPAEILSRPGEISPIEFKIIKTHPQVGYDILKDMEFPWPVAQAVLQHHERLNGSGYPQGLPEPDIIIEARILAVADVVEAMASHRPYRPALGIDQALEEITKNKGVLYDAEVVDTCLKLFNEKGFHLD